MAQFQNEIDLKAIERMRNALNELSTQLIKFSLAFNDLRNQLDALETAHPELFEKDQDA